MMNKIGICEKCVREIARHHTNYATVWYDLCVASATETQFIKPSALPSKVLVDDAIEYLEKNRYLITTESSINSYEIRLNGYYYSKEGNTDYHVFCINREHDEEEEELS
jgi:hypothetical protein